MGPENEAHFPSDETISFFDVPVRLSSLVEMLVSRRDNTHIQLAHCARWYKRKALAELYPACKEGATLNQQLRRAVMNRAIEMAIADSRAKIIRP